MLEYRVKCLSIREKVIGLLCALSLAQSQGCGGRFEARLIDVDQLGSQSGHMLAYTKPDVTFSNCTWTITNPYPDTYVIRMVFIQGFCLISKIFVKYTRPTNNQLVTIELPCNQKDPLMTVYDVYGNATLLGVDLLKDDSFKLHYELASPGCGGYINDSGTRSGMLRISENSGSSAKYCVWYMLPSFPTQDKYVLILDMRLPKDCSKADVVFWLARWTKENASQIANIFCARVTNLPQVFLLPPSASLSWSLYMKPDASALITAAFLNSNAGCGGVLQERFGAVRSPTRLNERYASSTDCTWFLFGAASAKMTTFVSFIVVDMHSCNDYVELVEVTSGADLVVTEQVCKTVSGYERPQEFKKPVILRFHSDSYGIARGFHLFYFKTYSECGGVVDLYVGWRDVLRYPSLQGGYPNNVYCSWLIYMPANAVLEVQTSRVDLDSDDPSCGKDNITIYRIEKGSFIEEAMFCTPQETFILSAALILVNFRSDSANFGTGFIMNLLALPKSSTRLTTTIRSTGQAAASMSPSSVSSVISRSVAATSDLNSSASGKFRPLYAIIGAGAVLVVVVVIVAFLLCKRKRPKHQALTSTPDLVASHVPKKLSDQPVVLFKTRHSRLGRKSIPDGTTFGTPEPLTVFDWHAQTGGKEHAVIVNPHARDLEGTKPTDVSFYESNGDESGGKENMPESTSRSNQPLACRRSSAEEENVYYGLSSETNVRGSSNAMLYGRSPSEAVAATNLLYDVPGAACYKKQTSVNALYERPEYASASNAGEDSTYAYADYSKIIDKAGNAVPPKVSP